MIIIEWLAYFVLAISWVLVVGSFLGLRDKKDSDKNRASNSNLFLTVIIVSAVCVFLIYIID